MAERPRLFVGIELPPAARGACAGVSRRLQAQAFPARFELVEKLHITLAFLGAVDPPEVGLVSEALESVASRSQEFVLTLDMLGAFPHENRPRIVWIGCRDQGAPFRSLACRTREAFEPLGFSFDKDAVAHVTIARVNGGRAHLPLLDVPPIPVRVEAATLFESLPAGPTTRYEVIRRTPFSS
jgi:2'-5' RNA ligase